MEEHKISCTKIGPRVYNTFISKNKSFNEDIEFRIQDLTEEFFDEAIKMLKTDFITEETLCVAKNISKNQAVMNELCYFWRSRLARKLSVGCFTNNGNNELVGVSIMSVVHLGETYDIKVEEKDSQDLLAFIGWLRNQYDVFEKYNIDAFLTSHALCVRKEYRNRGIATELIRVRQKILKLHNLKVTSTSYTVTKTQHCAKIAGHVDGYTISYEALQKIFSTFDFSRSIAEYFKIMDNVA